MKTLFSKLCKFLENNQSYKYSRWTEPMEGVDINSDIPFELIMPGLIKTLKEKAQNAKVFSFDKEIVERKLSVSRDEIASRFHLPFSDIIITYDNDIALGMGPDADIVTFLSAVNEQDTATDGGDIDTLGLDPVGYCFEFFVIAGTSFSSLMGITNGLLFINRNKKEIATKISFGSWVDSSFKKILSYGIDQNGIINRGLMDSLSKDIMLIDMINTDKRYFIIEGLPIKQRKKGKGNRIKRLHERPIYIAMKAKVIRKKLGILKGEGKDPHERRGHNRWLRDKKYKRDEHGEVRCVWVKNTWVGPSTGRSGNRNYRVILD